MPPPLTQTMYLRFSSKDLERQSSADFWTRILGRPKRPEDVTELIFDSLGCRDGAHDYMVLIEPLYSELWPKLTPSEQAFLDANLVPVSNVQVQSCLASLPKPNPPTT